MTASLNGHAHLNGSTPDHDEPAADVVTPYIDDAAEQDDEGGSERDRLEQELADTHDAIAAARQRLAEREAEVKAALREELVASRERLAEMDRAHDLRITAIRAEAEAAIALIMRDDDVATEGGS